MTAAKSAPTLEVFPSCSANSPPANRTALLTLEAASIERPETIQITTQRCVHVQCISLTLAKPGCPPFSSCNVQDVYHVTLIAVVVLTTWKKTVNNVCLHVFECVPAKKARSLKEVVAIRLRACDNRSVLISWPCSIAESSNLWSISFDRIFKFAANVLCILYELEETSYTSALKMSTASESIWP